MRDKSRETTSSVGFKEALLRETREELQKADSKASILLAATGIAYSALLSALIANTWTPNHLHHADARLSIWVAIAFGVVSILLLGAAVKPRLRTKGAANGIPYHFGDVDSFWPSRRPRNTYDTRRQQAKANFMASLAAATPDDYSHRLDDQIWFLGHIAQRKYRFISLSLWFLTVATALIMLSILLEVY